MAIYTGGMRQKQEATKEAKRLAAEARKQERKAQKRKGWSGMLGSGLGLLAGTALAGMTGGLAAPLLMAAGKFAGRKAGHELTRGMAADPSKIKSASKYGYGVEEAKTLRGQLESQMAVDPIKERGGFGKDVLSSYLSAGAAGELGGAKSFIKGKFLGEKGASTFKEALVGKEGWKGAAGAKEAIFGKAAESTYSPLHEPTAEDVLDQPGYTGLPFESEEPYEFGSETVEEPYVFGGEEEDAGPLSPLWQGAQGGLVIDQNTLLELAILSRMAHQNKAYDDTPLDFAQGGQVGQVETGQPTIAEIFMSKGKTLGGNNTQSLSQMLGR
mgnify:CR=1 FL=1